MYPSGNRVRRRDFWAHILLYAIVPKTGVKENLREISPFSITKSPSAFSLMLTYRKRQVKIVSKNTFVQHFSANIHVCVQYYKVYGDLTTNSVSLIHTSLTTY